MHPKYHKDYNNAEKLFESIVKQPKKTWRLISWDETLTIDFQYISEHKGWPLNGFRVKMATDKKFEKSRIAAKHEIIDYLAQFRLLGDGGNND